MKTKTKMKNSMLLILIFILISLRCDTTEPPPIILSDNSVANSILLKVEWTDMHRIKLKWNKSPKDTLMSFIYRLTQTDELGNKTTKEFTNIKIDTSYISGEPDSLLQGKRYWYKVEGFNKDNKLKDTSKTIEAKTLNPTSHDIIWQIDTLGQPGNFLNDVWGFDESNVYAIGAINMAEGITSIIKWDGVKWNYHSWPEGGASGIFGFSSNDIWIVGDYSNRGFIGHFNGTSWTEYRSDYFLARGDTVYPLRAVWGSSPDNVWAVGDKGTIIRWDGSEWKKTASPIDIRLNDILGVSSREIYAISISITNQSKLIRYDGNTWEDVTLLLPNYPRSFTSLWFDRSGSGYLVGNNITTFQRGTFNTSSFRPDRFLLAVQGKNSVDVIAVGQTGRVIHFNGIGWSNYPELWDANIGNELRGIYMGENKIIIVGKISAGAIIIKGERL